MMIGKDTKEENAYQIKDKTFHCIITIFSLLAAFFICLACLDKVYYLFQWDSDTSNVIGVICQVISGITTCVISIMGISFSLQDVVKFDIKIRDFYKMREDKHFSFLQAFLVLLVLLILNLVFLLFKSYILCIGCAILSFFLCIYVMCTEVPFMMASEKCIIAILKQRLASGDLREDYLQQSYNAALDYLICNRNLETAYKTLGENKCQCLEHNKRILYKLFDRQDTILKNLAYIEDPLLRKTVSDGLVLTAGNILCGRFKVVDIISSNAEYYASCIAQIYIVLANNNDTLDTAATAFAKHVCLNSLDGVTDCQKDFYYRIIFSVIANTVHNRNYHILKAIRAEYSMQYTMLQEKSSSTTIFAVISMFLYYLAEIESDVCEEWRKELREFVSFSGVVKNTEIVSWKSMYAVMADLFPVDCKEFMEIFHSNRTTLEYMLRRGGAHECQFYTDFAVAWYLTNVFNSYRLYNLKYSEELKVLTEHSNRLYLEEFWKKCYSKGEFIPTERMQNIVKFYGVEKNGFQGFVALEKSSHDFQNFIKTLKMEDEKEKNEKDNNILGEVELSKIKAEIEKAFETEYGFDANIKQQNDVKHQYKLILQKTDNTQNLVNQIVRRFLQELFLNIKETHQSNIKQISIKNNTVNNTELRELLNRDIDAITERATQYEVFIKENELKERYHALCNNRNKYIESHIFSAGIFCKEGFRFKISVDTIEKCSLSEKQFGQIVDQYKRADGQYIYQGIFMEKEELVGLLNDRYYLLNIEFRTAVEVTEGGIWEFNIIYK